MEQVLQLSHVTAGYGQAPVLHDVSLSVGQGALTCVIGPNGAGKSTLFKIISGAMKPSVGDVLLHGAQVAGKSPEALAGRGLSYVPEGRHVFADMTVEENLKIGGFAHPDRSKVAGLMADAYAYFPRLKERKSFLAGRLSGGEQQMLVISRALMTGSRLILIDEPSLGLAPKIVQQVYEVLQALRREQDLTLLVNEQSATRVLNYADDVYVLRAGRIQLHDVPAALINGTRLNDAYFGYATAEQSA